MACIPCPQNTYSSSRQTVEIPGAASQCTPCPLNFETNGPGQTSVLDCICSHGMTNANNTICGLCASGQYLDPLSNVCLGCPDGSTSPPGSVGRLSCTCPRGTRENLAADGVTVICEPCPINTYSPTVGVSCVQCPKLMITKTTGSTSLSDCQCSQGLFVHAGQCL